MIEAPSDFLAASARAARAAAGLVRLETSRTETRPTFEEDRIRAGYRRGLRLFKSLSISGDFFKAHRDPRQRPLVGWFITLTYRPDVDWQPQHISGYTMRLRKWCARRDVPHRYLWVAEQHKSGRVHYHAIVFLPKGLSLPMPDKSGMWAHGMSQRQVARKGIGYLVKYASKSARPERPWPVGLRLHGCAGLAAGERVRRSWWVLPKYIREQCEDWQRVRRARGGGWLSPVTGEWWPAWSGVFLTPKGGFA